MVKLGIDFINDNIAHIIFTAFIFVYIMIILTILNVKFQPLKKTKVVREIVIENFDQGDDHANLIPSDTILLDEDSEYSDIPIWESTENLRNNETCNKLTNKEGCVALGSCVWVTAKNNNEQFKRCVAANGVSEGYTLGSEGPEDKCVKTSKGRFIPWEEYYYLKNGEIIKGKGIETCN